MSRIGHPRWCSHCKARVGTRIAEKGGKGKFDIKTRRIVTHWISGALCPGSGMEFYAENGVRVKKNL